MIYYYLKQNKLYFLVIVIIVWIIFFLRTNDDSYSQKVDALKFANFYNESINGKVNFKKYYGRGGNYFSIEDNKELYHFNEEENLQSSDSFFNSISIGDQVKKEANSSKICIYKDNLEKCFTYHTN